MDMRSNRARTNDERAEWPAPGSDSRTGKSSEADFALRLVTRLEGLLEQSQPQFMFTTPGARTTTADPYDPWFRRPHDERSPDSLIHRPSPPHKDDESGNHPPRRGGRGAEGGPPEGQRPGGLEQVVQRGNPGRRVVAQARRHLTDGQFAHMDAYFPRDSPHELLVAMHLVAQSATLQRMTLAQLRCPVMVVEARNSCRLGLYHLRDVLVLERARCTIVMVPQPWVVSPTQAEWYRLDFLATVLSTYREQRWADVEIDDHGHAFQQGKDERRARGVACPRLGFMHREVERGDFALRLVARLEGMLEQSQPQFTFTTPGTHTTTAAPYNPWFRRPPRRAST